MIGVGICNISPTLIRERNSYLAGVVVRLKWMVCIQHLTHCLTGSEHLVKISSATAAQTIVFFFFFGLLRRTYI